MSLAHCPTCDLWLKPSESCPHIPPFQRRDAAPVATSRAGVSRPLGGASARNLSPDCGGTYADGSGAATFFGSSSHGGLNAAESPQDHVA